MNNKLFKIFALITLSLSLSIGIFAQRDKGVTPVSLNITIDDGVSQTMFGIGSDGGGIYAHGQNLVEAQFLSTGVLSFKSGNRAVNAFYSTPLEMNSNTLPAADSKTNVKFLTFVKSGFYLQTMDVGTYRCEGLVAGFSLGEYTRHIGYRAGRGTITNTGYVKVTRPDENTWIMESNSEGTCGSYDNIARIRDAKNSGKPVPETDYGRYSMPLKMTLTKQ